MEKYLGFPLHHGRASKKDFEFIAEKMNTRLASWKHRLLNRARRVTLASSVLTSIPSYYMQVCWLPQAICDQIDKIYRDFIWKGTQNKGINLVNWHKVFTPKALGGLGVRSAREANTALLGKLIWDIQQDTDKLWVQVLKHKYNIKENFLNLTHKSGSPTWGAISKAKEVLKSGYQFRLGAGEVSFWFDSWNDMGPLHQLLPYVDIHDSELRLNEVLINQVWNWDKLYTFIPNHIKSFLQDSQIHLNPATKDLFIWNNSPNDNYTTKAGFQWILDQRVGNVRDLSWKWIWKIPAQENIKFFFWLAFHSSIPTLATLHHRGISTSAECRI